MMNVGSAICKRNSPVTLSPSSRPGGATDSPCPLKGCRCSRCTLVSSTSSRCATGQTCKSSPCQDNMRVWSLREHLVNTSRCHSLLTKKVVRAVQTEAQGDQNGVSQSVKGPCGKEVDANPGRTLGTCFSNQARGCELFSIGCGGSGIFATKVSFFLPSVV